MATADLLNDGNLIRWLQSEHKKIPFITTKLEYEEHDRTEGLVSALERLDVNKALYRQKEVVSDLWLRLIGKAIVYLKYKDTRELYHDDQDFGVEKLEKFFNTFRTFEPVLYGAEEKSYRDHMAHMFSVFLAGEYLIKTHFGFDKVDVGDKELPEGMRIEPDEKEAMWCIMALTHDLGIALERMTDISPMAEDMLKEYRVFNVQGLSYPFLRLSLDDFTIQLISSDLQKLPNTKSEDAPEFITHIQSKYFLKFSEAYEARNHGIIGCLVLVKNLVFFLETDYSTDYYRPLEAQDARQFLIRRNILKAIASHSNENIYHLTLVEFPFLLTIFDDLHEWGRPRFIELFEKESPDLKVSVESLDESNIHYKITFHWDDGSEEIDKAMRQKMREYFRRKCKKVKRILRSAVDGKRRNFTLTLEVMDEKLGEASQHYKLIHKTPQDIQISLNNEAISFLQLSQETQP